MNRCPQTPTHSVVLMEGTELAGEERVGRLEAMQGEDLAGREEGQGEGQQDPPTHQRKTK